MIEPADFTEGIHPITGCAQLSKVTSDGNLADWRRTSVDGQREDHRSYANTDQDHVRAGALDPQHCAGAKALVPHRTQIFGASAIGDGENWRLGGADWNSGGITGTPGLYKSSVRPLEKICLQARFRRLEGVREWPWT